MADGTHRIRLRGPWNAQPLDQDCSVAPGETIRVVTFPATISEALGGIAGRFRFSRRFGQPTGLGDSQVVWLEIEAVADGTAALNDFPLGILTRGVQRFDVTRRLRDGNQLDIELSIVSEIHSDAPVLEVAIVIETLT